MLVPDHYYLAHCIAADLGMGAGIAVPMQKKFGIRGQIQKNYTTVTHPDCILTGRILNLITKKSSYGKPSYLSLRISLLKARSICQTFHIAHLAMPKIGCGLDRLQWGKVREMIKEIFKDDDIEILVCYL